jgi:hypothetical protein
MSLWRTNVKIKESDEVCSVCGHVLWPIVVGSGSKYCPDCDEVYYIEEVKESFSYV